jgi:DNA-binding Xre family transcriptional regulator
MNTTTAAGAYGADDYIAHQIKKAIFVYGSNKKELAEKTGISYSTIRRSLDQSRPDRRSLTVEQIEKIAAALGIQPSELVPNTLKDAA